MQIRRFPRLSSFALLLGALIAPIVLAASSVYETEPNNTPAQANRISGEVSLLGSMPGSDQDGYLWTVSDDDARKRWTLELQGIAGALTIADVVRLEYADNGIDVLRSDRLMKMGTRDGLTPSVAADLIFEPGEYLIGIAHTGGPSGKTTATFRPPTGGLSFGDSGTPEDTTTANETASPPPQSSPQSESSDETDPSGYRFFIREGKALSVRSDQKPRDSRESAMSMRLGQEFAVFETRDSSWFALPFGDKDIDKRWDITMQVPLGRSLDAVLYDSSGEHLASTRSDPRGHLTFPDLAPQVETYYVELRAKEQGFIRSIGSEAVGQRVSGEEAEPNGKWQVANRVDLSQPLTGRISDKADTDYFQFQIDEATSDQTLALSIDSASPGQTLEFCLFAADKTRLQCRHDKTPVTLPGLVLNPADYGISVSRAPQDMEYRITLSGTGPIESAREAEPNETIELASSVPANNRIKGHIDGNDTDFFRFVVTGEPQLWRFQVIGEGLFEVSYQDIASRQSISTRPAPGEKRVRLDNLFLLPGQHFLRVSGSKDTDYTILARPLGQPDANAEREPNNDISRMQLLAMGQTRTGLLSDGNDKDLYRFFLGNWDHIRVTVHSPVDGIVVPDVSWYGLSLGIGQMDAPGQSLSLTGVFPPGDYQISLTTRNPSDAEYQVSLERLPRFSCASDCEPSGRRSDLYFASPLPADGVLEGLSGDWRDVDVYLLPKLAQATELLIHSTDSVRLSMGIDRYDAKPLQYDALSGSYRTIIPAGGPYQLIVDSRREAYRLALEFPTGPAFKSGGLLPAELRLTFDTQKISAYRSYGQHLTGVLEVHNSSIVPIEADLNAVTSDYRWQVALDQDSIAVAPGSSARVGVQVLAATDAWADRPVRVSVLAVDDNGAQAEAWQDIGVDRDIAGQHPQFGWGIPEALRGGFNLAWAPFKAEWTEDLPQGTGFETLRDGLVFNGFAMACCSVAYGWEPDYRPELTLRLPGDSPIPIAGTALNHFGGTDYPRNIRRATLLLSEDGINFREVLSFETLPVETEQYFALPTPVPARFARLRIDATFNQRPGANGVMAGEWKVIAQPGHDLSEGRGFNLADPALGGHVVSDSPPKYYSPSSIVDTEDRGYFVHLKPGENQNYVIGFNHDRAARIERIEWVYANDVNDAQKFDRVAISISMDTSVGPWEPLTEMSLAGENAIVAELDTPTWARFVKFTAIPRANSPPLAGPATIRIWEQPGDEDYRSVLTEWGYASRRSFYEAQQGLPREPELMAMDNDTRERAAPLQTGQLAAGQVALAKQEHWYRVQLPQSDNSLTLTLTGDPTVRTIVQLETSSGEPITLRKDPRRSTPRQHVFEAVSEPGAEIYLHVLEPPRNVVFTWDTSPSINNYLPTIYSSLSAFASQVTPGQEAVNLLPFSSQPLLRDWYGEPYVLQTILNEHPRGPSSSSAEHALQDAAELLAPLAGTKAIVIITDGITVHHGPMWKEMAEIQPRIFGIGVGGSEAWNVDVFEDWASVSGGYYSHLVYDGEMEVAFDRAVTLMRRPADYTLLVNSEYREAPGPGRLTVVSGKRAVIGGAAVELILDASGSMLQRLEGKRRIEIAKEVLIEAVSKHIPAGTPVALRVFGHKEVDACRTDLEIPLSPLSAAAAAKVIEGIEAMNLARTPIADSLAAVVGDLKGTQGRAAIVLVTDGEETCDGDPAKVIESLQARGIDVSLNIVGFAIDDAELASQFASWAEQGNGRYFAANNQAGLSEAIEEALRIPFSVYDGSGSLVTQGFLDSDPVELAPGRYRVVVGSANTTTFDHVDLKGDRDLTISLDSND